MRFQDATGAFGAFQWLRPAEGRSVAYGEEAVRKDKLTVIRFGNYIVEMEGAEAVDEHIEAMLAFLPRVQMSPAPPFVRFVPTEQAVPGSQRYVLGPAALARLVPEIPPSVAAFHFGTEGQFVRYETPAGLHQMVLFSYPSSQIARGQIEAFQGLPDVVAKRSGPLIAAVVSAASLDEAQRLLARVRYSAEVTVGPREFRRHDDLRVLILDIVLLCLILAGLMIVGGVIVAGARQLVRRFAPDSLFAAPEGADMVRLDIERRG
jgi:hypothetical protein